MYRNTSWNTLEYMKGDIHAATCTRPFSMISKYTAEDSGRYRAVEGAKETEQGPGVVLKGA